MQDDLHRENLYDFSSGTDEEQTWPKDFLKVNSPMEIPAVSAAATRHPDEAPQILEAPWTS